MLVLYSVCHTSGHYNLPWNVKILSWIMACISEITVILIGNYRALEMFLIMIECYSSSQPVCSSDVFIYMSRPGARELSVFYIFPIPLQFSTKLKYETDLLVHIILIWVYVIEYFFKGLILKFLGRTALPIVILKEKDNPFSNQHRKDKGFQRMKGILFRVLV